MFSSYLYFHKTMQISSYRKLDRNERKDDYLESHNAFSAELCSIVKYSVSVCIHIVNMSYLLDLLCVCMSAES